MTEVDVMRDMSYCIKGECNQCSRHEKVLNGCRTELMRDANCIMKMQHDSIKGLQDEYNMVAQAIA